MIPFDIGDWIRREYDSRNYTRTKVHLVESVVAGAAVVKCGKRMEPHTKAKSFNQLIVVERPTQDEACKRCW